MSERITRKDLIVKVDQFIKDNADEYDDIQISIVIEKSEFLTTISRKKGQFYAELE